MLSADFVEWGLYGRAMLGIAGSVYLGNIAGSAHPGIADLAYLCSNSWFGAQEGYQFKVSFLRSLYICFKTVEKP